jgi:hypothetical protein
MNQSSSPEEIQAFHEDVVQVITQLELAWSGDSTWDQKGFGVVAGTGHAVEEVVDQAYRDASKQHIAPPGDLRQAAREAKSALVDKSTRAAFCKALKSIDAGSYDVAKDIVIALLPLSLTGAIALSATPLVWGLISFTIARIGAKFLCSD